MIVDIFQYRTLPSLRFTLTSNAVAVDLTGKTLWFVVGRKLEGTVLLKRECTVVGSPKEGVCTFHWEPGDTDYPEENLDAELAWEMPDGRSQTLATLKVNIKPSLGGA